MMPAMGLRGRLALFFVVITIVPLVIMIGLLQMRVERDLRERSSMELASVRGATTALIEASRARAGDLATDLVLHGAGQQLALADPPAAQAWLDDELAVGGGLGERADVVVLADPAGSRLATAATRPAFSGAGGEVAAPDPDQLAQAAVTRSVPAGVLLEVREVRGALADGTDQLLGYVVAGVWTDARLLDRLGIDDEAAFVAGGRVLAAAGAPDGTGVVPALPGTLPAAETVVPAEVDGERVLLTVAPLRTIGGQESGAALVLWSPARDDRERSFALVLLLPSVAVAALFGHLLARTVVAPVRRAASAANSPSSSRRGAAPSSPSWPSP
jgi:hypothetical protein